MRRLLELPLEAHIEVDHFIFENVGKRLRIGNDTLHYTFVKIQLHLADHRRKRIR